MEIDARDMVFTCPYCGAPLARTQETDVDIHPGAAYTCDQCTGKVVFVAMTTGAYCAWATQREQCADRTEGSPPACTGTKP